MYKNLFKSGDRYQLAVFLYMSKLGSVGAALVSSLNIGDAMAEVFRDVATTSSGTLGLNTLVFQDDISKMNDHLGQAN